MTEHEYGNGMTGSDLRKMALEVSSISFSDEWGPPMAKKMKETKKCDNESE